MPTHRTPRRSFSSGAGRLALGLSLVLWLQSADSLAAPPGAPAPQPLPARDFIQEGRILYRVVACSGDSALPAGIGEDVVQAHCAQMKPMMDFYRHSYLPKVRKFLGGWIPAGSPEIVVYPFGGGDLLSALTAYPNASEVTTLSLEHVADPTRFATLKPEEMKVSLQLLRKRVIGLLKFSDSKTDSLQELQRGGLSGQLAFFLIGLAVHGFEPVSIRYFQFAPDGKLVYLSRADIESLSAQQAKKLRFSATAPDFSAAFSNAEITFRPLDPAQGKETRVHRHIAADLSNAHLPAPLLLHLGQKARIAAMTKAASYLLWRNEFSFIRDYLLKNMDLMVSDSTGIPPEFARKAGFVQETAGQFSGSFLGASAKHNQDFRDLWTQHPGRSIDFRFGYLDKSLRGHLLLTKRESKGP